MASVLLLLRKQSSLLFQSPVRNLITMASLQVEGHSQFVIYANFNRAIGSSAIAYFTPPKVVRETSYEEAIRQLNNLQSNMKTRQVWHQLRNEITPEQMLNDTVKYLERGGLTSQQLETLNVVHVAGTKGKGTTCAFVESILRHAGLRTGFYSSPHLVAVRERIRINGKPLTEEMFAKYFFSVHRNMEKFKETTDDMPAYFRFLTCLAFYVFFQEKVDVVVLEVGIGGAMDPTNIIRQPIVTGITSLGLEHQNVLGKTLEEISLAKAGIMKPNVPCFTVPTHPPHILRLLQEHATLVNCPLLLSPPLEFYNEVPELGVNEGSVTFLNASIAIQLSTAFIQRKFPELLDEYTRSLPVGTTLQLLDWHRNGLAKCVWPGRFQIFKRRPQLTYFLDGAHTVDSLAASLNWFTQCTTKNTATRVVVFAITGERNRQELLKPFVSSRYFNSALFCPILVINPSGADNWSAFENEEGVMKGSVELASICKNLSTPMKCDILPSINHVLENLDNMSKDQEVNVLVTGSLHLVGSFLSLLDPELNTGGN